jgi:hypothetical protein
LPRYFTIAEAEQALPDVERALRDVLFHKAEYQKAYQDVENNTKRISMAGGSRVDPGAHLAMRARRDTSAAALKDAAERVEQAGALIKDANIGLIDFLSRYQGQEVCLCWKLGEDKIRFWHSLEDGFRGRKLIDEDFIQNHRGEMTN